MKVLGNMGIALGVLVVLYLCRNLIKRFIKDVFAGVYKKTVLVVSTIVFVAIAGLLVSFFTKK